MVGTVITLQRVLSHASLAMAMKCAHFRPGHLAEVVMVNFLAAIQAVRKDPAGVSKRLPVGDDVDYFRASENLPEFDGETLSDLADGS
jgi:hypothetical protein